MIMTYDEVAQLPDCLAEPGLCVVDHLFRLFGHTSLVIVLIRVLNSSAVDILHS
jgi:hypothetical protein